jgi:hypothetical protein
MTAIKRDFRQRSHKAARIKIAADLEAAHQAERLAGIENVGYDKTRRPSTSYAPRAQEADQRRPHMRGARQSEAQAFDGGMLTRQVSLHGIPPEKVSRSAQASASE